MMTLTKGNSYANNLNLNSFTHETNYLLKIIAK